MSGWWCGACGQHDQRPETGHTHLIKGDNLSVEVKGLTENSKRRVAESLVTVISVECKRVGTVQRST